MLAQSKRNLIKTQRGRGGCCWGRGKWRIRLMDMKLPPFLPSARHVGLTNKLCVNCYNSIAMCVWWFFLFMYYKDTVLLTVVWVTNSLKNPITLFLLLHFMSFLVELHPQ